MPNSEGDKPNFTIPAIFGPGNQVIAYSQEPGARAIYARHLSDEDIVAVATAENIGKPGADGSNDSPESIREHYMNISETQFSFERQMKVREERKNK